MRDFAEQVRRLDATASDEQIERIVRKKASVERALRAVMARTERVTFTRRADAMVRTVDGSQGIEARDAWHYLRAAAVARLAGARDPLRLCKSVPYPLHFLGDYELGRRMYDTLEGIGTSAKGHDAEAAKRLRVQRMPRDLLLTAAELRGERLIGGGRAREPARFPHPKLRALYDYLDRHGVHERLWMPPTVPYLRQPSEGDAQPGHDGLPHPFSKVLVFSRWRAVPEAVTALLGSELLRRMKEASARPSARQDAHEPHETGERRYLRFRVEKSSASGTKRHSALAYRELQLVVPLPWLADALDPLKARAAGEDPVAEAERSLRQALDGRRLRLPRVKRDAKAYEWTWLTRFEPRLLTEASESLERAYYRALLGGGSDGLNLPWELLCGFGDILKELSNEQGASLDSAARSALRRQLLDLGLGAPGTLAWRTLGRFGVPEAERWGPAVRIAWAFVRLFRRPEVHDLVVGLHHRHHRGEGRQGRPKDYWRQVAWYCRRYELQAVLDEAFHLYMEQHAGDVNRAVEALEQAATPRRPAVVVRRLAADEPEEEGVRLAKLYRENRTERVRPFHVARFATAEDDEGTVGQRELREAFDSPFWPFVLVTTSIGQEGLDFHRWSCCVMHWDLPPSPVDLEQREGRVHRYKGLAVRRNVAAAHLQDALRRLRESSERGEAADLWALLFEEAERAARRAGHHELWPCWIHEGREADAARHAIVRWVPLIGGSEEAVPGGRLERLRRALALYRITFGQPRQEDLLAHLADEFGGLDDARNRELEGRLRRLWIDLRPLDG